MNAADEPTSPDHVDLPLPDYDHLPLNSLILRVRTLDLEQLDAVLAYERAHADRLPVVQGLEQRRVQLEAGAEPSGGSPTAFAPEKVAGPPVQPRIDQTTEAPSINPPSHGDPTNPAQPRS